MALSSSLFGFAVIYHSQPRFTRDYEWERARAREAVAELENNFARLPVEGIRSLLSFLLVRELVATRQTNEPVEHLSPYLTNGQPAQVRRKTVFRDVCKGSAVQSASSGPADSNGDTQRAAYSRCASSWGLTGGRSYRGSSSAAPQDYSSFTTCTVTSAVTSRCSRTGTLYSPKLLDGLVQLHLAAVDGEVLLLQRVGHVLGGDRSEELIVFAGLLGDGDGNPGQQLRRDPRLRSSAWLRGAGAPGAPAPRSCWLASVAATARRLGSRKLRA